MGYPSREKSCSKDKPLPTGGKHGFIGVRGGQGRGKNKFQGTTPKKTNRTKLFNTPREAAVALAELRQNLSVGGAGGAATNQQHSKQQPVLARFGKAAPILRPSCRVFCASHSPLSFPVSGVAAEAAIATSAMKLTLDTINVEQRVLPQAQMSHATASSAIAGCSRALATVHVGYGLYPIGDRVAAQLCRLGRPWVMAEPCKPRMRLLGRAE